MFSAWRTGLVGSVVVCAAAATVLAQQLPTDPNLVAGQLDNGLRYIVRKHDNPAGRAAIWIHMHTGSLNEKENQRGLAHYLEHLAFNGSENFPPGAVVPFFQSLGMQFGRDQNAFTNFEQTTYQLALPDAKNETLAKGMTFFADVLFRMSLFPKEIEAERQIIQEERRRGLSGRQRTTFYVLERIAPGSIYGQRITIGTEETINGVQEADFRDYYGRYYTASNATLMVVADTDPAQVVNVIQEKFGPAPKKPKPARQALGIKAYDKSFAIVASDAEVRSEDVRITRLEPARPAVTTEPLFRSDLVERLCETAMNRRLEAKVSRGGTSYLNAFANLGNQSNAIYTANLSGRAAPGKWKQALEEMVLELQRAREFGFSPREIDDAKKQMIAAAERAVETESTQPAQALIARMNSGVTNDEPLMSPAQRLALLNKFLPTITPAEVKDRFFKEFDPKAVAFVAVLPDGPGVPSESDLLQIGTRALAVTPTPEEETAGATQLMSSLPKPGSVQESSEHATSRVTSGWLGNNTRFSYRFMDTRKDQVSVSIALIGGELLETAANRGITQAAQVAWSRPATKNLSSNDIRDLMTGKKVTVRGGSGMGGGGRGGGGRGGGGPAPSTDSITLTISGSPEELETGFQLTHLLLTEPKIEAASFEQYQTLMRQTIQESLKNPLAYGMRTAAAAPFPDSEARAKPLSVEQVDRLSAASAQAWLEKLIKESPIEVTIVGDLPKEKAMELTAKYIGSLPSRQRVSPTTFADLRKVIRPQGPRTIEQAIETPTAQAFVLCGFYGADETNVADARALNMASRLLSTRMVKEVREEAQLVYSIGSQSRPASAYLGFGTFSAGAPTDPSKVDALVAKIASMYETFAKEGPTQEELDIAKKQMANTFEEQLKEPNFWSGRMERMTFRGTNLDDVVGEPDSYQAMTPQQVRAVFAKYYSKPNSISVVIRPAPGSGEAKPTGGH